MIIKTGIHGIWLDFLEDEVKPTLFGDNIDTEFDYALGKYVEECFDTKCKKCAPVTQLVECRFEVPMVTGSNPVGRTS